MQTFNSIKNNKVFDNKFIYNIKWSRYWKGDSFLGFETNIDNYDIKNKRIIIIEDVIASGNTIWTLKEYLDNNNNEVVMICSALIQESSPIVNKSFCETYSSMMIEKTENDELDPFWYPPIYSLRHLLFGDKEMNNFYNVFNEKYFNGNNDVEVLIKKIRR